VEKKEGGKEKEGPFLKAYMGTGALPADKALGDFFLCV